MQQDPSQQPTEASQFPYQQPPPSPPYTQYPRTPYPPPPMSPPKKRRNWLLWGIAALLVIAVIITFANLNNASTSTPPAATQAPAASNTPAATQPPAPTPTHPTKFTVTHGRPHIGGPFSDFVGKYGQPIGQGLGNSYNFQSDTRRPDGSLPPGPNVTPNAAGMVIGLDIVSDSTTTVSFDQARLHCEVWLPSDAVEFNSTPPYIDYHSSVGEIVLMVNDFGDCVLNIGQS